MKIALIGHGKMGKMIEQIALERGHKIVCIIDKDNQADMDGADFASADVAIEFTAPDVAYQNVCKAFERGVKVVSGSTGWIASCADEMKRKCNEEGKTLFWASNFSVGVALFSAVNKYLAELMNGFAQYGVTMEETHHIHKLDAPSGTAITLAEDLVQRLDRKKQWVLGTVRNADGSLSQPPQPVTEGDLAINCVRRDEVPGIHQIVYESLADSITITHDAHNRSGFALGAVLAAEYTAQHNGWLTIDDLFKTWTKK